MLFAGENIPEFDGMYVQTKDNKFIELQKHKQWGDYRTRKWTIGSAYSKTNDFVINRIKFDNFKYFISRGNRNIDELEYGIEAGLNNGYYWIVPSKKYSGRTLSVKWAKNGNTHKAKVSINKEDIFWLWWNYKPYLVKFY